MKTRHESALATLKQQSEASVAAMVTQEQHDKALADLRAQHESEVELVFLDWILNRLAKYACKKIIRQHTRNPFTMYGLSVVDNWFRCSC